jgi:hypothetical protein
MRFEEGDTDENECEKKIALENNIKCDVKEFPRRLL